MNDSNKRYLAKKPPPGSVDEPLSVVLLETKPVVKQIVTKRYPDRWTLSLLVVNEKLVEKSMTFGWEWDIEEIKEEKEKGAEVSFK
jgi:hypothetical protein